MFARAGRSKDALAALREIVERGFAGAYMAEDSDLSSLRGDPEFAAMVAEVKKRNKGK